MPLRATSRVERDADNAHQSEKRSDGNYRLHVYKTPDPAYVPIDKAVQYERNTG